VWQFDGSMKIIDHKKIFKLSKRQYAAVENMENIFGETPGVDSVQLKITFYQHTYSSVLQLRITNNYIIYPLIF